MDRGKERMSNLERGHKYTFKVVAGAQVIQYTADVLDITSLFVKIKDKFGVELSIALDKIISYEEVKA